MRGLARAHGCPGGTFVLGATGRPVALQSQLRLPARAPADDDADALFELRESLPDEAFLDAEGNEEWAECRGRHEALALTWLAALRGSFGKEGGGEAAARKAAPRCGSARRCVCNASAWQSPLHEPCCAAAGVDHAAMHRVWPPTPQAG